jgi:membrane protein DedA with SNARE-associated domain
MAHGQLPGVLGDLAPVLNQYGYLAVGGLVLLEDFGVPAPGETILIASAVYAGAGKLNILLVILVAFAGAVIGDNIGYVIGNHGGRRVVLRWGRYVFVTEERLEKAEGFVGRHGGKIVVVARFIEGLRQLNGIVAGISDMRWRSFAVFNAIGAALWVGVWASLGYFAGDHIDAVYGQAQRYSMYLLIAVAAVVVFLVLRAVVRRKRGKQEPAEEAEQEESASA